MDHAQELSLVLREVKDGTIATLGPDGGPHATVVSFVTDGSVLWFDCLKTSQKARNLAADPRVSMTVLARWRERFPAMDEVLTANGGDYDFYELKPVRVDRMDYRKGLGHGHTPRPAAVRPAGGPA